MPRCDPSPSPLVVAAACAAFVLAAPASAAARPDLARMALAAADVSPTAKVVKQGYADQKPYVAFYARLIRSRAKPVGRARITGVESDIGLFEDADEAALALGGIFLADASDFRRQVARDLRVPAKDVHVGRVDDLRVGDGGALVPVRVESGRRRLSLTEAYFTLDRVFGALYVYSRTPVASGRITRLARRAAAHVREELLPRQPAAPAFAGLVPASR
jgi:hypothetical protein